MNFCMKLWVICVSGESNTVTDDEHSKGKMARDVSVQKICVLMNKIIFQVSLYFEK